MAHHHLQKRKRVHKELEPYPHPNAKVRFLDGLAYAVSILGPFATVPQVLQIWVEKNASGVSLISWSSYLLFGIILIIYSVVHKVKPLIIMYSLNIILNTLVVLGILRYQ
jgi:uncharacterized protein with PQ loop repeat